MVMTTDVFGSQYLKAGELQGREATVTIESVKVVTLNDKRKLAIKFFGKQKGFVVNKTNSRTIERAYGPNTDGWINNQIVLYPAMVDFQGEQVEAIRVRIPGPTRQVTPQFEETRQQVHQHLSGNGKPAQYSPPTTRVDPRPEPPMTGDPLATDDSDIPF